MVVLGRVEGHGLTNLCGRMIAHLHQFAENFYGGVAFLSIVEPNGGKILCADVDALSIGLLKVVDFKEIARQGFVGNHFGVVFHFDGFQMPLARVFHVAAHETDGGFRHAFEPLEVILHAPKATC